MDWMKITSAAQILKEGITLLVSKDEPVNQSVTENIVQKGYELEQALDNFINALKEKGE